MRYKARGSLVISNRSSPGYTNRTMNGTMMNA